jgi:hypothetical protein
MQYTVLRILHHSLEVLGAYIQCAVCLKLICKISLWTPEMKIYLHDVNNIKKCKHILTNPSKLCICRFTVHNRNLDNMSNKLCFEIRNHRLAKFETVWCYLQFQSNTPWLPSICIHVKVIHLLLVWCHSHIHTAFILCLTLFCFNGLCQFTPLLNLCSLVFSFMPFGWLHSVMLIPYFWCEYQFLCRNTTRE